MPQKIKQIIRKNNNNENQRKQQQKLYAYKIPTPILDIYQRNREPNFSQHAIALLQTSTSIKTIAHPQQMSLQMIGTCFSYGQRTNKQNKSHTAARLADAHLFFHLF